MRVRLGSVSIIALGALFISCALTGCLVDGESKIERCSSTFQNVEVNPSSSATSVASLRLAYRVTPFYALSLTRIMVKGIISNGTGAYVEVYRGSGYANPEAGTLIGSSSSNTTTGSATMDNVWFTLLTPISMPLINGAVDDGYWIIFYFSGGSVSLDYGSTYGSRLRGGFYEKNGSSWTPGNSNGPSFGYEASTDCI